LSEMPARTHSPENCVVSKATVFSYQPSPWHDGAVKLTVVENLPPSDGAEFEPTTHAMALHLGRPLAVRQRRADVSRTWTFTRGDLTLIPAGCRTTIWTKETAHFLQIDLGDALVQQAAGPASRDVEVPCLFSFEDPVCRELSLSMLAEAESDGPAARLYVESAAVVLAQRLLSRGSRPARAARRRGLSPGVLRRAKEFLHDAIDRNPGIGELSAAVGMNVDHFSRMFKRSTGVAPHQYLGEIRLERAKRLLASGRAPIIEIAYEIGYANPSQFSAFFRKRTGQSPSDFRRSAQTGATGAGR
jgi:AraC family transcriptional regulator